MADRKISDLTALTTPATGDLIPIVDISEAAAADKNKSITVGELLRGAPDGTAAAPGIAFESDGGNGMFLGGTDILAFSTGGNPAVTIDASQRLGLGTSAPGVPLDLHYSNSSTYSATTDVASSATFFNTSATTNTYAALKLTTYGSGSGSNVGTVNLCALASSTPYGAEFVVQQRTTSAAFRENLRITHDGKVGIGTTSPGSLGELLHVVGKARFQEAAASGAIALIGADATAAYFDTGTYGLPQPIAFRLEGDEKARIDSSGRLLVGTTSARTNIAPNNGPQQQLSGTTNETSALLVCQNIASSSWGGSIWLAKNEGADGTNTAVASSRPLGRVSFAGNDGTSFVEGARIEGVNDQTSAWASGDCPGRLVFSTTADGASSPTERMRISRGGSAGLFCDTSFDVINLASSETAGSARWFIYATYGASAINTGTQSFGVYTNGNVVNTNNSYTAISDIKLKENIVDAGSQWNDLKAIQVRNYNFKEETGHETHTQLGVIAQEIELVSPGLVSESPDRDAEGNDLGTVTKSVNYSVLYMKAVKALQEAMERIEQLEAKVAALEAQ